MSPADPDPPVTQFTGGSRRRLFIWASKDEVVWARSEAVGYPVQAADKNTEFRRQHAEKGVRF